VTELKYSHKATTSARRKITSEFPRAHNEY
jgi:hypothetical protein